MRFILILLSLFVSTKAFALTVEQHAADTSNPHGGKMKITQKLNVGTDGEYATSHALKVVGGATIDTLDLGGGTLNFGTASSVNGSLSIGTTTAGSNRLNIIGTVSATTFVGDGTFLTGVGAGSGTGNWTDTGSSTQTYYPDTVTRKVAIGTTTATNQFAVAGDSNFTGTVTATWFSGDGSGLSNVTATPNADSVTSATIVDNTITGSDIANTLSMMDTTLNIGSLTVTAGNFRVDSAGSMTVTTLTSTGSTTVTGTLTAAGGLFTVAGSTGSMTASVVNAATGNITTLSSTNATVGSLTVNGSITASMLAVTGTATMATTSGRVGIGMTTPATTLHVIGTVTATHFVGEGSGITGIISDIVAGSTKITVTGVGTRTIDVDVDKLGTGSPTAYKFLCGDETWKNAIGEIANVGTGSGIYKTAVNNFSAQLKGLMAGTNISISATTDDITINSIGTASQWVNGGDTLYPGTLTVKVAVGTTTGGVFQFIVVGDAAVVGNVLIPGTLTTAMIVANAPPAADDDDIVIGSQLAQVKSDMLVEWFDHQFATSEVHGVGSSTIASIVNVQTYAVGHPGSVNNDSFCGSTTAFSFSADSIVLRNAVNNLVCINNPGNGTNTITLAGPIANGRATATAFNANTWIYFYWIWNGTTLATLSSETYKTQGGDAVTLPTGYTHWCLAAIVRSDSSALTFGYQRGNIWFLDRRKEMIAAATNTAETTNNISAYIPPQCINYNVNVLAGVLNDVPAYTTAKYQIRLITGQEYFGEEVTPSASGLSAWANSMVTLPNTSQSFITIWTLGSGNTLSGYVYLLSYSIPNGGA